jgi:DNA-directed RNA polymerase
MGKGLSANILHSFDSAHMCATTIKAASKNVINIGGIHDCFLTTPSEMSALKDAARESFADIYQHDWLTRIKDKLKSQLDLESQEDLPAEPQLGTLDLNHTRSSTYFLT